MAVEALSGDGGQVTFTGHDLTQQHQVAPVDVAPIKGDHVQQFLFDGLAGSLNAQCLWREKGGHVKNSSGFCGAEHASGLFTHLCICASFPCKRYCYANKLFT